MNSTVPGKELPKLWSKNYLFIILGNFFTYLGFQMLVPTFPAYIKEIGGTDLSASLSFSVTALSALILRSISGNAADSIGRRPLLVAGFIIIIFFNLSFFFLPMISLILIFRFFQGIGWGITSTTIATIVSDTVPSRCRGEGIGYYSLTIILATSLSAVIGIWTMNNYNFKVTLLFSTILIFIGTILSHKVSTVSYNDKKGIAHLWDSVEMSSLFERAAGFPSFLCFIHSIAYSGIMSFIMLLGKEIKLDNVWIFFISFLLMVVISRPFAGKLFDKKGHAVVILPGALFMIIGLVLLSYVQSTYDLVIASMSYGLGFGAVQPSLQAWAINRSPINRKGAANGTFLSSLDLGYAIGAVLLGFIAANTSYEIMYRTSSLFIIAFLIIYGISLFKVGGTKVNDD